MCDVGIDIATTNIINISQTIIPVYISNWSKRQSSSKNIISECIAFGCI